MNTSEASVRSCANTAAKTSKDGSTRSETHDLPALQQFADGLLRDRDAVVAGLSRTWSSGQVEGQITRVKLLKRVGYGRAKLDLLRTRILLRN
ncbi:transposase [Streptomyces sp. NPDC050848]|uniref:transposase n=1 Tax=Streptomyces sp. NPDC050848 TaxID=3155791 RepID=UPI0034055AA5